MTDVYLFNRSKKAAVSYNPRTSRRVRAKPARPQSISTMDILSEHTCMARFIEPAFCENDISLLTYQYLIQPPFTGDHGNETIMTTPRHEDGLAGNSTQANVDRTLTRAQRPARVRSNVRPAVGQLNLASAPMISPSIQPSIPRSTSNVLRSRHPRPETDECRAEEDSRRYRFALDGPDTNEIARFAAISTPEPLGRSIYTRDRPERLATSRMAARSLPNLTALAAAHTYSRPGSHHQDASYASYVYVIDDQDSLSVDDPRRNYDFADFMDQWRATPFHNRQVPTLQYQTKFTLRSWQPPDEVARSDVAANDCDMQGMRWRNIGADRDVALQARKALHPVDCPYNTSSMRHEAGGLAYLSRSRQENIYGFRSFHSKHRAQFSHYQLRNVLAATNHSDIFYAQGSSIVQTSGACLSKMTTVMDLSKPVNTAASFRITCLATSPQSIFSNYQSNNILLAGGFNGEYAFLNLNSHCTTLPTEGFVTHSYNGLVTHVHTFASRYSGIPQATFCTNDAKVRLLDLASLRFTHTFSYDHAMNSSSTSPDGRLRILAGDSNDILLTSADDGSVISTLHGHADHCFATAWSSVNGGRHVATASQDGMTCLWDTRNWSTPLHRLPSVMSCARSLQFADDDGTLVVAENDDVVTVYDPLMPSSRRQDIRFFGAIAGTALLDGGRGLIVANSDQTVGGLMMFQKMMSCHDGQTVSEAKGRVRVRGRRAGLDSDFVSELTV